jgi:hypothetical protein
MRLTVTDDAGRDGPDSPATGGGRAPETGPDPSATATAVKAKAPMRAPGWREVMLVAVAIVVVVLGAAAVTGLLPRAGQDLIFRTPLAIVVLLVGTVGLLARLAMRRPPA